MVHTPLLILFLSVLMDLLLSAPRHRLTDAAAHPPTDACITVSGASLGMANDRSDRAFEEALQRLEAGRRSARYLAVADMTLPSTSKRLFIIDLHEQCLVTNTWVAHGQGSGELMCDRFSNIEGSHATSRGLYRIGPRIMSPKHGPALLLQGLDKGRNCQAEAREVIMHGADYVSEAFIAAHGRLGRSWGCPAVAREDMEHFIGLLAGQGYLYVYGH
jgi:hypothetical protein